MSDQPKKLLLVGFQPYGTYSANPTAIIANHLHGRHVGRYIVESTVFPATIPHGTTNRATEVFEAAIRSGYHCIVCLGMASQAPGFKIERRAFNRIRDPKYCAEFGAGTRISREHELDAVLEINLRHWNLVQFEAACRRTPIEMSVVYSDEPGGFCCNHLMWQMAEAQLEDFLRYNHIPWIFMHMPACPEALPAPELLIPDKTVIPMSRLETGIRTFIELTHF